MDSKTDEQLIHDALAGSQDAFTGLHRKYASYIRSVCRRIVNSDEDLDDLSQEAFLLAFTRLNLFKGNASFRTWLTSIAKNVCWMKLRRFRQETNGDSNLVTLVSEDDDKDWTGDHIFLNKEGGYLSFEAHRDLDRMLGWLAPGHRRMFEMAYLEDVPTKEIAGQFGLKAGDVNRKLRHGKKLMRERLR